MELGKTLLALGALALSGCSVSFTDLKDALLSPDTVPEMTIPAVNRAAIESADLAAVMILSPTTGISSVAVAVQLRDAGVIYNGNDNRGVTLQKGLIYQTLGFGTNLQAVLTTPDDPIALGTPPAAWPDTVTRTYLIAGRGTRYDEITATCQLTVGGATEITVVGVTHRVLEAVEQCETDTGESFNNIHYVDARSGQIWRSSQWTGPVQQNVQIDVIEPFDAN